MSIYRLLIFAGLILAAAFLIWRIAPGKSKLLVTRDEAYFPIVSGFNLDRQEFEFPRDFGGDLNLLIVPLQQYQQNTVNTWIPAVGEIEASFPGFIYYELPTIYEMSLISRTFVNEGMRAGIPDQTARERTITLYLDKATFKSALNIPDENDIYLFLVDREGSILWRETGAYTEAKAESLVQAIRENR